MRARTLVLALLTGTVLILPVAKLPAIPAQAVQERSPNDCAKPAAVQELEKRATKVVPVTHDGRSAVRFYLSAEPTMQDAPVELAFFQIYSPAHRSGNYNYYHRAQAWVDWEQSYPCTEADLYFFGTSYQCFLRPVAGGAFSPASCNIHAWSTLQIEYGAGWDSPWGFREYYITNTPYACTDTGNPHQIGDAAHVHVRTWARVGVRYNVDNYLTSQRITTSYHINAGTKAISGSPQWWPAGATEPEPSTSYPC
jgi:hypothetical protein